MSNKKAFKIYLVEDSITSATIYKNYLADTDYDVRVYNSGNDAVLAINESYPDLLILDIELPDINGLEILKNVKEAELPIITIVITSHGSVEYAVEAMRNGSFDFIEKPFSKERLLVTVNNAIQQAELVSKIKTYSEEIDIKGYYDFVGSSLAMQVVYRIIENAANCKASVFITGESGTGKELCASAIHQASIRKDKPFIAINCAAIPKDLFESQIFGHVKGAFSGATNDRKGAAEEANGGTLFLDEMCEMNLELQAKLLRLIQTGTFQRVGDTKTMTVDVRFVCATNRDPLTEVSEGRFREDLYYRLNVIPIQLPALRERDSDIIEIAKKLLSDYNETMNKEFKGLDIEVESAFLQYDWPGNVRELQNVIEHAVIMNNGENITLEMLPQSFLTGEDAKPGRKVKSAKAPGKEEQGTTDKSAIEPLWKVEKRTIEEAIRICEDNVPVAAAYLGVSASTIYRKLKNWESLD